jgi:bifunctional non-homologous end joining protein LigD
MLDTQLSLSSAPERRLPSSFIMPCTPILAHKASDGPEWLHECYYEGYRLIVRRDDDDRIRVWSGGGTDWTGRFGQIVDAVRSLPIRSVILDGVATTPTKSNDSSIKLLGIKKPHFCNSDTALLVFDLLMVDGQDLRSLSLLSRRNVLAALLDRAPQCLLHNRLLMCGGEQAFAQACEAEADGLISKRKDSPYRSGRCDDWQLIRRHRTLRKVEPRANKVMSPTNANRRQGP